MKAWSLPGLTYSFWLTRALMMPETSSRSFQGGSWDLRKQERRQAQVLIQFPDRRRNERREAKALAEEDSHPDLTWMSKPGLDD